MNKKQYYYMLMRFFRNNIKMGMRKKGLTRALYYNCAYDYLIKARMIRKESK